MCAWRLNSWARRMDWRTDESRNGSGASGAINAAIAGETLVSALRRTAATHAEVTAQVWNDGGCERRRSWRDYRHEVAVIGSGLIDAGVEPGDVAVIVAPTSAEHAIADMALVHAGAIPVSAYDSMSPQQIADLLRHCGAKFVLVDTAERARALGATPGLFETLKGAFLFVRPGPGLPLPGMMAWEDLRARGAALGDQASLERRAAQVRPDDLLTLVYTSGTTGAPKAIKVTNRNVLWIIESCRRSVALAPGEVLLSHLPMAHAAERRVVHWEAIRSAATAYYKAPGADVADALAKARPHLFFGTPRIYEKLRERMPPAPAQGAPRSALGAVGLDRCRAAMVGGAPPGQDVMDFFRANGLALSNIWGSTEMGGAVTWWTPEGAPPGSVGRPTPGWETRLADDGEILVRSGAVSPGYYADEAATAEVFLGGGWCRSGDIAQIDGAGVIRIVGRKKELIITRGGKNISPAYVEAALETCNQVSKACVIGDGERYLVALILPAAEARASLLSKVGEAGDGVASTALRAAIGAANATLSQPEQIKRFFVVGDEWSEASGEFTQTLKMNRKVIAEKYRPIVEGLYDGKIGWTPISG